MFAISKFAELKTLAQEKLKGKIFTKNLELHLCKLDTANFKE